MKNTFGKYLTSAALVFALLGASILPDDRALLDAAKRGDVTAVKAALKGGADVNAAQGDGLTALHMAAQEGNIEIVKLLVGAKANVEAKTRIGAYTPLHMAAGAGETLVVRALLDAGASASAVTSTSGVTPLHLAAKAMNGEAAVEALIAKGAPVNARESSSGQTALMFASAAGRAASVKVLLQHGADPSISTEAVDLLQRVAIDRAATKTIRDAAAAIRQGANGTGRTLTPAEEQAAIAAQRKFLSSPEQINKVIEGFDPASLEGKGTFYKGGAEFTTMPVTETLVGKTGGLTALLHAARTGHSDVAKALLDGGANIDQQSADGSTPLVMALLNGQFDLALELIQRGANVNLKTNTDGVAPLFATLQTQWALRFTSQPQPRAQDGAKTDYMTVLNALLNKGADPNVSLKTHLWHWEWEGKIGLDITGATPLWRAAFAQDLVAVKALVAHGANPNTPSTHGPIGLRPRRQEDGRQQEDSGLPFLEEGSPNMHPIHAAAGGGYLGLGAFQQNNVPNNFLPTVKYLVEELGADVNLPDSWGYTPLHYAAVRGGNDLIEYLVSKGADVKAISRLGQSPVDMARGGQGGFFLRTPYPKTVELLSSLGSPFQCLATHFRDTGDYCAASGVAPFEDVFFETPPTR